MEDSLEAALRVTETVARARSVDDACASVLEVCTARLGADRAAVLLVDPDGVMRFHASVGLSESYQARVTGHSPWPPDVRDPAPVLVPDVRVAALGAVRGAVLEEGIAALAFVPLVSGGRLIGKFMVYFDAPRALSAAELMLARLLAAQVAFAIARLDAERRADERTAELEAVLEAVPEGVTVYGPDGRARLVNAAVVAGSHRTRESVVGAAARELLAAYELTDVEGRAVRSDDMPLVQALEHGRAGSGVFGFRRRDGSPGRRWLQVSANPAHAPDGRLRFVVVTSRDVTGVRRAAEVRQFLLDASALLASSLDYEATLAALTGLAVPRLADWCAVEMFDDGGSARTLAYAHADPARVALVERLQRLYPPDPNAPSVSRQVRATGQPLVQNDVTDAMLAEIARDPEHLELMRALGLTAFMMVPLRVGGAVVGAIRLASAESGHRFTEADVETAMSLADRAAVAVENARLFTEARASRARLDVALEVGRVGTWEYEIPTDRFTWTSALASLHGVPLDRLVPTLEGYVSTIHPADRDDARGSLQAAITTGGPHRREYRIVLPDGSIRWVEARAHTEPDAEGRPLRLVGARVDVTDRKLAEARLEEERERLGVTLASIGDAVIATDRAGAVTLMNAVARTLTGWEPEDAMGRPLVQVFDIVSERTGQRVQNPVEKVLATGRVVGLANHTALRARDGSVRSIADSAAPIRARDGNVVGVVLVFRDVTQEQRLERELAKASKLESIGVLAGGIAHDFNNILTSIAANVSLADRRVGPEHPAHSRLTAAQVACERARELTRQLLTFSRGGAPIRSATAVRTIVYEACGFALQGAAVRARYELPAELWPVDADAGQIGQVVHNLALNAAQAMPEGGNLRVAGANLDVDDGSWMPLAPGRYVRITFTDDGPGIAPENLGRVFDPFFTTKATGSGLGLATAYSIVKRHDGHLMVDSTPGVGTTFTLLLPAAATEPKEPSAPSPGPGGAGRVLVLDDDDAIRELAAECLHELGYEAVCVAEGAEAVDRYVEAAGAGRPFDVVILDLTVPGGVGGREALRRLRVGFPDVRAIVSSGYSNDPVLASFREHGFVGILQKPFVIDDLARVVAGVLKA